MSIFEKIQNVRNELQNEQLKMTGKNKHAGYAYFELADFVPALNKIMLKHRMTAIVSFTIELASLTAIDLDKPEDRYSITSPMGSAALKGCHEVQNIGATETYQRRYLYQAMFDIAESDGLDATQGEEPSNPKPQTKAQNTPPKAQNDAPATTPKPKTATPAKAFKCSVCGKEISEKLYNGSKNKYGASLCSEVCKEKYLFQKELEEQAGQENTDLPFN